MAKCAVQWGVTEVRGGQLPQTAPSIRRRIRRVTREDGWYISPGAESLREAPKGPNNVTSIFFSGVHLLPKDIRFEYGGTKLLAPGAI